MSWNKPMYWPFIIGVKLRAVREIRGYTQQELGDDMGGIYRNQIVRLEQDITMARPSQVRALTKSLKCKESDFVELVDVTPDGVRDFLRRRREDPKTPVRIFVNSGPMGEDW